ncbi:hypothetical protein J2X65_005355 [Ancylobacter sp. 3268]|nr:hypothetical protein [Ancylobacter sp. 3268]
MSNGPHHDLILKQMAARFAATLPTEPKDAHQILDHARDFYDRFMLAPSVPKPKAPTRPSIVKLNRSTGGAS